MDAYSDFIELGTSLSLDEDTVVFHIKKLLKLIRSPKKPFTLVCDIDKDFGQRVRAILLPEKGKLAIDADAVEQNTKTFSEFFNKRRA